MQQEPVDGRSDLFALGATYYECLTGRRAFTGKSSLEICAQVLHVDPTPQSLLALAEYDEAVAIDPQYAPA